MISFKGLLLADESGRDEPAEDDEDYLLPAVTVGQGASRRALEPEPVTRRARPPATPRRAS